MTASQFGDHYYERNYSPPVSPRSQPHGLKRKVSDDEVEAQSQISTHFKKLRLNNAKFPASTGISPVGISYRNVPSPSGSPTSPMSALPSPAIGSYVNTEDNEFMRVDDTAHRVFVPDLEAEIAAIEADEAKEESKLILPDFDKEVARFPQHLLQQQRPQQNAAANMQMVLYRDPTSISVPEAEDAVRKTVIEARSRARQKQREHQAMQNSDQEDHHDGDQSVYLTSSSSSEQELTHDPDAMDIE